MGRNAAVGILCLAVLAIGLWAFLPHDTDEKAGESVSAGTYPPIPADAFEMTVESVHDGDTLRATVSEPNPVVTDTASTRVRLIGLDTPEISPDECWGAEATDRLSALLPPGSTIWVAPDREVLDQYGRHLLYVWTPEGRFVNADMIARGDGTVMLFEPNTTYEDLFRSLEAAASAADLGLWSAC